MENITSNKDISNNLLQNYNFNYRYNSAGDFKFLYFSDSHMSSIPPAGRYDNYPMTIIRKLDWALNHAKAQGCRFVLCGGDFNTSVSRESNREEHKFLISNMVKKYGLSIFFNPGNHDTLTSYATLFESPISWYINDGSLIPFTSLEIGDYFRVVALPYSSQNIEVDSFVHKQCYSYLEEMKDHPYQYLFFMVHQLIESDYYAKYGVNFKLLKSFNPTATLVGHEHADKGTYEHNGMTFIQPGALSRYHNAEDEHKRAPKVAVVSVKQSSGTWDVEYTKIPIEEPRRVFYMTRREVKNDIDSFRDSMRSLSEVIFSASDSNKERSGKRIRDLIAEHSPDEGVRDYLDVKLQNRGF